MTSEPTIAINIPASIYNEFVLRVMDPATDVVAGYIVPTLQDFLNSSKGSEIWSATYLKRLEGKAGREWMGKYGDPDSGYQWKNLLIRNGSQIMMNYAGRTHLAEVRHNKIIYQDREYSPSELAFTIANGTSRNAWRDLLIKEPGETHFLLAHSRRELHTGIARTFKSVSLSDF